MFKEKFGICLYEENYYEEEIMQIQNEEPIKEISKESNKKSDNESIEEIGKVSNKKSTKKLIKESTKKSKKDSVDRFEEMLDKK